MRMTRRNFLGTAGATGAGGILGFLGLDLSPSVAYASAKVEAVRTSKITTTVCPYCAVGCGALVMAKSDGNGRSVVVNVEGDPDHPINEGALCPKGASLYQMANNEKRLKQVLYRAPGQSAFTPIDWTTAAKKIAARIKKTRDASFTEKDAAGQVVNRTTAIASVGSAALDNEECWLYQKLLRAMGLVYIEHQARI
ncbi:MAG: twin-arginine translocation signal domain-containing protein [Pirellulales bacterium]|nr:twin-arginine translocation signal domain-containing protein [Pirellulales bacterium]